MKNMSNKKGQLGGGEATTEGVITIKNIIIVTVLTLLGILLIIALSKSDAFRIFG
jgi:hypothetical protein